MGTLHQHCPQCSSQLSSSAALLLLQLQLLTLLSRLPLPTTHPLCILSSVMHHPSTTTRGMSSQGMSSLGTTTSTILGTIQDTTDTMGIKHSKDTTTTTMDMPAPTTTIWCSRKTRKSKYIKRFNVY